MTKIRTVKPELFRHEALFEAEQQYHLPLRLAYSPAVIVKGVFAGNHVL